MTRRHEGRLYPAQEQSLFPARDGEVEDGLRAAVLDLDLADGRLASTPKKLSLECSVCGYGIVRAEAPERCPMCHAADAWTHTPWRPLSSRSPFARVPSTRRA